MGLLSMKPAGDNEYRILFAASGNRPFFMNASGDSVTFADIRFGGCLRCNSLPKYPKYLKRTLRLYFSNGETDMFLFCSDDLRTKVSVEQNALPAWRNVTSIGNSTRYLINGWKATVKLEGVNRKHKMHRLYEIKE